MRKGPRLPPLHRCADALWCRSGFFVTGPLSGCVALASCSATPTPSVSIHMHPAPSSLPPPVLQVFPNLAPFSFSFLFFFFFFCELSSLRSDLNVALRVLCRASWEAADVCFFFPPIKSVLCPWTYTHTHTHTHTHELASGNTQHPRPWCLCAPCVIQVVLGGYSYERVTITTAFWLALRARELTGASSNVSAGRAPRWREPRDNPGTVMLEVATWGEPGGNDWSQNKSRSEGMKYQK